MSQHARKYGLALVLPFVATIGACSESSVVAPGKFAPTGPSRNLVAGSVGAVKLCAAGVPGMHGFSVSYTPGAGSTDSYDLPQGATVSLAAGSCATVFTATLTEPLEFDPVATVHITQTSGPAGSALDHTILTEMSGQAACGPAPCGDDVKGTSATVDARVNGYHGSVVSYWNAALGCAFTQGYWKNHTNVWPAPYSAGAAFYSSGKSWIDLFNTPPRGSGYIILAHQFMAATLNVANGASMPSATQTVYDAAAAYFGGGAGGDLTAWASVLDGYNNGLTNGGPPHCD